MSTQDDLGRALRERADGVASGRPLTVDDVRRRARQVRRRRAGGAAAGVALVAAVVLPLALLGGAGSDRSVPPPAPEPTRASEPSDRGVPTIQEGVLIYPNGPRFPIRIGRDHATGFAELGTDRWVLSVVTEEEGRTEAAVIGTSGQVVARYPMTGGLAASRDHTAVAWVDPGGAPQLLVAGAEEPQTLASVTGRRPTAVAITGECSAACEVVVRADGNGGGLGSSWTASTTGTVETLPTGVPAVVDASSDGSLLAGIDGFDDDVDHACGGVYGAGAGAFLWHGCEDNVFAFSPDGALVMTSFAEGMGPTGLKLRDSRTGTPVAEVSGGLLTSYTWEDDQHLLAVVVEEDGSTSVQRIGTSGPPETVLEGFHTEDPTVDVPVMLPRE